MALPRTPAQRHRRIAADFAAVAAAVQDWGAQTPVPGWTAADVVDHLITWSTGFLAAVGGLPEPDAGADPATRFRTHSNAIQDLLEQPAATAARLSNPHIGEVPVATAIDRFYTTDVLLHTWDLARSNGLEAALDDDECAALLSGMLEAEDAMRGSGHYGPAVPVPEGASIQDRVLGFIGRDPAWRPPT